MRIKKNWLYAIMSTRIWIVLVALLVSMTASALSGSKMTKTVTTYFTYDLYKGDKTAKLVMWNGGSTTKHSCSIPETVTYDGVTYTVTHIAATTFKYNSTAQDYGQYLYFLYIPATITNIEEGSFATCVNLQMLNWYTQKVPITQSLVSPMKKTLTSLTLDAPVGDKAFYGFSNLSQVITWGNGKGITSIGNQAFYNCSKLTTINNGMQGLISVGSQAFQGCSSLQDFYPGTTSLESIGEQAFYRCNAMTRVSLEKSPLKTIGEQAFYYCSAMTDLKLPTTLTSIGKSAFEYCKALPSVDFSGIKNLTLGENAFANCTLLKDVTFPKTGVGTGMAPTFIIGTRAFWKSGLTNIHIEDNFDGINGALIGEYAFSETLLKEVTINTVSTKRVKRGAFYWCKLLEKVTLAHELKITFEPRAFYYCSKLTTFEYNNKYQNISDSLFYDCESLNMEIPFSADSIGNYAFYGCSSMPKTVKLDGTQKYIGTYAMPWAKEIWLLCKWGTNTERFNVGTYWPWYSSAKVYVPQDQRNIVENKGLHGTIYGLKPSSIEFSSDSYYSSRIGKISVYRGSTATFYVDPSAFNYEGTYYSTDPYATFDQTDIAHFDVMNFTYDKTKEYLEKGKVTITGLKAGKQTVYARTTDMYGNTVSAPIEVEVLDVTDINLSYTSLSMTRGATSMISASCLPAAADQTLTWSTSNSSVVSILSSSSTNVIFAAKSAGTATLTATSPSGVVKTCTITVTDATVNMNRTAMLLKPGESGKISATASPSGGVSWISENPAVATVDANGNIAAVSEGSTYVVATSEYWDYATARCLVVVSNESAMYVGGIYYTPIEGTTNDVRVTNLKFGHAEYYSDDNQDEYSGTISVPEQITYDGVTYKVTEIGDYAFYRMPDLQMVIVPASVKRIGNHAFEHSERLVRVQFAASSALSTIDYNAFKGCYKLNNVAVPNSVTEIGMSAFEDCTSLAALTLPTGLTTISPSLCRGCKVLNNVTIPDNVKVIGQNAFRKCEALNAITYPTVLSMIDEYAFAECISLSTLTLPAKVASLQNGAYSGCTALQAIVLPPTIEGIGANCFSNCTALQGIQFNNRKPITIGEAAFEGCSAMAKVLIADLTAWAHSNFSTPTSNPLSQAHNLYLNRTKLSSISITSDMQYVNQYAFAGVDVSAISVAPAKYVSDDIAAGSTATVSAEHTISIASRNAEKDLTLCRYTLLMQPGSEEKVKSSATGVTWESSNTSVATVTNGTVKAISEGVAVITAKSGKAESNVIVRVAMKQPAYVGNIYYNLGEDGTASVSNLSEGNADNAIYNKERSEYSGVVNIPETVTYAGVQYKVTSIEANALENMKHLQMVVVPKSIATIDANACKGSKNLARVSFANEGDLTTIGYGAFQDCHKLDTVLVPHTVTSLGASAFRDCKSLNILVLSNALSEISQYLCYGDSVLNDVVIPNSVKVIGKYAFSRCQRLANIMFSDELSMIDENAFEYCNSLKNVVFPNKLASLQNYAFSHCASLLNVDMPATLEGLGAGCFSDDPSLEGVYFNNTKPISIGDAAFFNCNKLDGVYIKDLGAWVMTNFGTKYSNPTTYAGKLYLSDKLLTDINVPAETNYVNQYAFSGITCASSITVPSTVNGVSDFVNVGSTATMNMGEGILSLASRTDDDSDLNYSKIVMNLGDTKSVYAGVSCTYTSENTAVVTVDKNGELTAMSPGMTMVTLKPAGKPEMKCLVYVTANPTAYVGNIFYDFSSDKYATVVDITGKNGFVSYTGDRYDYSGIVNIPATVTYAGKQYAVEGINANAFKNVKHLQKIIVPASVTTIGVSAFEKAENLQRAEFAADSKLTSLKSRAFYSAKKLDNVVLPNSLFTIEDATFQHCEALKDITLPNKLTTMGEYAFANCDVLEKIELPATLSAMQNFCFAFNPRLNNIVVPVSMQGIGQNCFKDCKAMTDIQFKNTKVMTVGENAFSGCTALKNTDVDKLDAWVMTNFSNDMANPLYFSKSLSSNGAELTQVVIPNTAQYINQYAFVNCEKMTSCEIPASVSTVSDNIFLGCSNLTSVKCIGSVPADFIGTRDLSEMSAVFTKATLYVPEGSDAAYKADSYWKHYTTISTFALLKGDVNGDGIVSMADANMIMNAALGNKPAGFNESAADLDGDGIITKADAELAVKKYLGSF